MAETELIAWEQPPAILACPNDEVHLWCGKTESLSSQLPRFVETLAAEERTRSDRFRFLHHRDAFIVAHGMLRVILSRYEACKPALLWLETAPLGKPYLRRQNGLASLLRFNLSHTEGLILLAVAMDREVGVDVEWSQKEMEWMTMAEHFFAPTEVETLRRCPAEELRLAFFRCWTRKEAYLKARGDGLSFPTQQFAVSCTPDAPLSLHVNNAPEESQRWKLYHLAPQPDYVGALACEAAPERIRFYQVLE
ncbi:MAG TPA: 4'-phosphopantetheinyl transferase superfamily protein [Blastocatellia bacterium]|nr:4'-phosphopantetheinyl transferase superfamily protein [Blastocatellia bacterium]